MIGLGQGTVHESADDPEVVLLVPNLFNSITEHLASLNQGQHFQISVTGFHQFPASLRTALPCTDTSHF